MSLFVTHGISALLVEDGQESTLLRYAAANSPEELAEKVAEFNAAFAARPRVRIEVEPCA